MECKLPKYQMRMHPDWQCSWLSQILEKECGLAECPARAHWNRVEVVLCSTWLTKILTPSKRGVAVA